MGLKFHLELALDIVSPLMSAISLATESKRASGTVQGDCPAVGLDEGWYDVGFRLILCIDLRNEDGEGGGGE